MKVHELLLKGYEILKNHQIDSYIIDCQLLLGKVLNRDRLSIITHRELEVSEKDSVEYYCLIEKRKHGMPVKYILEETEFMGLNLTVRSGVLIPRADTEILVEEVLKIIDEEKYVSICDVCCGSGAIGVSIASFNNYTKVQCYDISTDACSVTKENIQRLNIEERVSVEQSDLLSKAIAEKRMFDVIVSNPPYIREEVIPELMKDVRDYEPYIALCGGRDGLDFYRRITEQCSLVLKKDGLLAYEIGHDQEKQVSGILVDCGFYCVSCKNDLAGNSRVVIGFKRS